MITYRDILRRELISRIERNPSYSLRAYARDLNLRPSHLSQVLNNLKGVSPALARNVVDKLDLEEKERGWFLASVESLHGRHKLVREEATNRLKEYQQNVVSSTISLDRFALIADWYHFAILEILKIEGFQKNAESIARSLNIPVDVVEEALNRLKRIGLLKDADELILAEGSSQAGASVPSDCIRLHHEQILNLAKEGLASAIETRDYSTTTIAIRKSQIPEMRLMIRDLHEKAENVLEPTSDKDSVYVLSVQFFEITNRK